MYYLLMIEMKDDGHYVSLNIVDIMNDNTNK